MTESQADYIIASLELLAGLLSYFVFYGHVIAYGVAFLAGGFSLAMVFYAMTRRNIFGVLIAVGVLSVGSVVRADEVCSDTVLIGPLERARVWAMEVGGFSGDTANGDAEELNGTYVMSWNGFQNRWTSYSGVGIPWAYIQRNTPGMNQTRVFLVDSDGEVAAYYTYSLDVVDSAFTALYSGKHVDAIFAGKPDSLQVFPLNCCHDEDGDGVCDVDDPCPDDPTDMCEPDCEADTDGDGLDDCEDPCPTDPTNECESEPDCELDTDGDGVNNCDDPCPYDPYDACGDCEMDTDGDGLNDCEDPCPEDSMNTCDDGPECPLDRDCDGCPDALDPAPDDPEITCTYEPYPEPDPPEEPDPPMPEGYLPPYWWTASQTYEALLAKLPASGGIATRTETFTATLPCPGGPDGRVTLRWTSMPLSLGSGVAGEYTVFDSLRRLVRAVLAAIVYGRFGLAIWRALRQY